MIAQRRTWLYSIVLLLALVAAACGASETASVEAVSGGTTAQDPGTLDLPTVTAAALGRACEGYDDVLSEPLDDSVDMRLPVVQAEIALLLRYSGDVWLEGDAEGLRRLASREQGATLRTVEPDSAYVDAEVVPDSDFALQVNEALLAAPDAFDRIWVGAVSKDGGFVVAVTAVAVSDGELYGLTGCQSGPVVTAGLSQLLDDIAPVLEAPSETSEDRFRALVALPATDRYSIMDGFLARPEPVADVVAWEDLAPRDRSTEDAPADIIDSLRDYTLDLQLPDNLVGDAKLCGFDGLGWSGCGLLKKADSAISGWIDLEDPTGVVAFHLVPPGKDPLTDDGPFPLLFEVPTADLAAALVESDAVRLTVTGEDRLLVELLGSKNGSQKAVGIVEVYTPEAQEGRVEASPEDAGE